MTGNITSQCVGGGSPGGSGSSASGSSGGGAAGGSAGGGSAGAGSSDGGASGGSEGSGGGSGTPTPSPFDTFIADTCSGGNVDVARLLEETRNNEDHHRIVEVVESCYPFFETAIDPTLGRPLSSWERLIRDGEFSMTINDEMATILQQAADEAWLADSEMYTRFPDLELPLPSGCRYDIVDNVWRVFDDSGVLTDYQGPGCVGDPVGTGDWRTFESAEAAEAGCQGAGAMADRFWPPAPPDSYFCGHTT